MDAMETVLENMPSLDTTGANKGQFKFSVGAINQEDINFLDFDGTEHTLSGDYDYNFRLELLALYDPAEIIGKPARFEMLWNGQNVFLHGVVAEVTTLGKRTDGEECIMVIRSPLHPLNFNIQNRVFLNKNVVELIEGILLDAGLQASDFSFKTKKQYPAREFTVQYKESDFDFITRFMTLYGLFFTFEQTDERALLVIYDDIADVPAYSAGGEILYEPLSGETRHSETIFAFNRMVELQTDSVQLKDYNYRTPEANLFASSKRTTRVRGAGEDYNYADNYKTLDEGTHLSDVRQHAYDWQRETYIAESDCRGLTPGLQFTLINHPNDEYNGDYVIIGIEQTGDQGAAHARGDSVKGLTYRNKLHLLRSGIPFSTGPAKPRYVHGVFTAMVETTGGDYAYLDDQGRYKVRMPYDMSPMPAGEASHPIRQVQSYSGSEYGMHFPLHASVEVVVTCVNGDIDRPVLLGALHNPDNPCLVTSTNNSQNILRSWGDNELFMEDRIDEEQIDLFTREKKNILTMDASSQGHKITLSTAEGEMELYCARSMQIESGDTHSVQSGNDHILYVENEQTLHTKNKEVEFKAATDIRKKAGKNIELRSETKNIEMHAGNDMVIDVMDNMSLEVRNDNLNIIVTNGNFEVKVAKAVTVKGQGGGPIHIGQSGGKIEVATGGDISIQGNTVNVDGNNVYLKGATVKQGGGGSAGSAAASTAAINLPKLGLSSLDAWVANPLTQADNITTDLAAKPGSAEVQQYTSGSLAGENISYKSKTAAGDLTSEYNQKFQVRDENTNEPLPGIPYQIMVNGDVIEGKTDESGMTQVVETGGGSKELELRIISDIQDFKNEKDIDIGVWMDVR